MANADSPIQKKDDDYFNREAVARHIYQLATDTPDNWSTRIGLYGSWGEGKTSVLRLLEEIPDKEEFAIVKFSPSNINTSDLMWKMFFDSLAKTLEEYGLDKKAWIKSQFKNEIAAIKKNKNLIGNVTNIAGTMIGVPGADKILNTGAGFVKMLADTINSTTANDKISKKLQKKLKDRRFLVIIDDLDRANPELIPELLLNLRDLLDLPNFIFVLAFDYNVITRSIENRNGAWGNGQKFLEKIIDYPIVLPSIDQQDATFFLNNQLKDSEIEKKIDLSLILENLDYTPRKLKLVSRILKTTENSLKRFNNMDIDYRVFSAWIVFKIEYPQFANTLLKKANWNSILTNYFYTDTFPSEIKGNSKEDVSKKELLDLIENANLITQKEKILTMLNSVISSKGHSQTTNWKFVHSIKALNTDILITYKELIQIIENSNSNKDLKSDFNEALNQHSKLYKHSLESVSYEACWKLISLFTDKVHFMSEQIYKDKNYSLFKTAIKYLNLIDCNLQIIEQNSQQYENRITSLIFILYENINNILLDTTLIVSNNIELKDKVTAILLKYAVHINYSQYDARHEQISDMCFSSNTKNDDFLNGFTKIIDSNLSKYCISHFKGSEPRFPNLSRTDGHKRLNYLLININSIFWVNHKDEFIDQLTSNDNELNMFYFLVMLKNASFGKLGIPDEINLSKQLIKNYDITSALWNSTIKKPLEDRALSGLREIYDFLVDNIGTNLVLTNPEWLSNG